VRAEVPFDLRRWILLRDPVGQEKLLADLADVTAASRTTAIGYGCSTAGTTAIVNVGSGRRRQRRYAKRHVGAELV
jgi:hypothetical protein